ncbi:hypothetical protein [Mucilaginibacter antarcticus]|uniref:hypothetical protein n=1 Tax=Mucilaginibacter antarcticus TaxID=1855725 RepID=UPI00363F19A8
MCDADLFHLGTADFAEKSKLLRKEFNIIKHLDIDKGHWRQKTLSCYRRILTLQITRNYYCMISNKKTWTSW